MENTNIKIIADNSCFDCLKKDVCKFTKDREQITDKLTKEYMSSGIAADLEKPFLEIRTGCKLWAYTPEATRKSGLRTPLGC